ncbi:MAG: glycosyltransferase [Lachnospiraceae bacterium]|nr:glycosyltransferase [Lachnospiraceae bacterium]
MKGLGRKMYLISIIIPIYNKEKYLIRCLDSLEKQTYKNLEIILVDDGSNDGSLEICRKYKNKTKYLCKLISQDNYGPSSARNAGLDIALGEYIVFLDADDFLDERCIEICNSIIETEKIDFIEFDFSVNEKKRFDKYMLSSFSGNVSICEGLLCDKQIKTVVCGAFYSYDIIKKIRFRPDIKWGEDSCFKLDVCMQSKKAISIDAPLYINCTEPNTLSRMECNSQVIKAIAIMLNYYMNTLENMDINERMLQRFMFNRSFAYLSLITIEGKREICEQEYKELLNYCKKNFFYVDIVHKIAYITLFFPKLFSLMRKIYDVFNR